MLRIDLGKKKAVPAVRERYTTTKTTIAETRNQTAARFMKVGAGMSLG